MSPFALVPRRLWPRLLCALVLATLACMAVLHGLDAAYLRDARTCPLGIITFELAASGAASRRIMGGWDAAARSAAAFSIGLDFLFLCLYAPAIALVCCFVCERVDARRWPRIRRLCEWTAWAQGAAAALDGFENYHLVRLLLDFTRAGDQLPEAEVDWRAARARQAAQVKFVIVACGLAVAVGGCLLALLLAGQGSVATASKNANMRQSRALVAEAEAFLDRAGPLTRTRRRSSQPSTPAPSADASSSTAACPTTAFLPSAAGLDAHARSLYDVLVAPTRQQPWRSRTAALQAVERLEAKFGPAAAFPYLHGLCADGVRNQLSDLRSQVVKLACRAMCTIFRQWSRHTSLVDIEDGDDDEDAARLTVRRPCIDAAARRVVPVLASLLKVTKRAMHEPADAALGVLVQAFPTPAVLSLLMDIALTDAAAAVRHGCTVHVTTAVARWPADGRAASPALLSGLDGLLRAALVDPCPRTRQAARHLLTVAASANPGRLARVFAATASTHGGSSSSSTNDDDADEDDATMSPLTDAGAAVPVRWSAHAVRTLRLCFEEHPDWDGAGLRLRPDVSDDVSDNADAESENRGAAVAQSSGKMPWVALAASPSSSAVVMLPPPVAQPVSHQRPVLSPRTVSPPPPLHLPLPGSVVVNVGVATTGAMPPPASLKLRDHIRAMRKLKKKKKKSGGGDGSAPPEVVVAVAVAVAAKAPSSASSPTATAVATSNALQQR